RLESRELPTCRPTDWTNDETIDELYSYYLKKRTLANINWQKKRAWSTFFRATGCTNIMPFGIDKYKEAKTFARINGPGCSIIKKLTIHHTRFSEEAKDQFEKFFSDKSIVNMSSYKVDLQTKLPVLYLKDNKTALWKKFLETYPDGYKQIIFMTELARGCFQYREDLGGLCSICCQYGYNSILIDKVEKVRRHMKRDYEKEILININGQ
ncbi:546_t:CDS:2, partial [Diversispora eburnea]